MDPSQTLSLSLFKVSGLLMYYMHHSLKYLIIISPVPSPVVTVSVMVVSGSPLSLICSIHQSHTSVTTPTYAMFSWNVPNNGTVNAVNDTSVKLMISSVMTADSGDYICSVTLTDSSSSMYIIDSEPVTATVSIIVSK